MTTCNFKHIASALVDICEVLMSSGKAKHSNR